MPFDQSVILEVYPPKQQAGVVYLSWRSSAPAGQWYQVYVAGRLAWNGQATRCSLPWGDVGRQRVDVGAVDASEARSDLSSYLPAPMHDRARLEWQGGTFESPEIAGWRIYSSLAPGEPVSYTRPLATVAAYDQGIVLDGYGMGGYGDGGFGAAAGTYTYTSGPLRSGTTRFSVMPFDLAGNEGEEALVNVVILVPPLPPARDPGGARLHYTYNAGEPTLLYWLASPSAG